MKIILVINKIYRNQIDANYWNVFLPLQHLGHEVILFDTSNKIKQSLKILVEKEKPDLIFCCMTGDLNIAPNEPWEDLLEETKAGRTKTFNWFCDDTWRFNTFSSRVCEYFNVCSTPEPTYIEKFKQIGYNNILLGNWHCSLGFFPNKKFKQKDIDSCFIGYLTNNRKDFFQIVEKQGVSINKFYGLNHKEMLQKWSESKLGINLSTNDNDPARKTQMKLRMFEVPAARALLVTEYHPGLEQFYTIDKEIITFRSIPEFIDKMKFLNNNPAIIEKLAFSGHQRFIKEHESKIRLKLILEEITKC